MKLLELIKQKYLWQLAISCIYLMFFIFFPTFNLIDDGASLFSAHQLYSDVSINSWHNILVEESVGRLRPMYHLYFFFLYSVFGTNPFFYWLAQSFLLGISLIFMSTLLFKVTKQYVLSGLIPLLLMLYAPTAENFYRLGTAEPKQMVLLLLLFYIVYEIKEKGSSFTRSLHYLLIFTLSILFKEVSIFFIVPIAVLLLWKLLLDRQNIIQVFLLFCFSICISTIFVLQIPKGSYGSGFQLELSTIKNNLLIARLEYAEILFPLFLAFLLTCVRFLLSIIKKKINFNSFFWQVTIISQLVIYLFGGILPWQHQLPRYYYPIYMLAILYIGFETFFVSELIKTFGSFFKKYFYFFSSLFTLVATTILAKLFLSIRHLNFSITKQEIFLFISEVPHSILLVFMGTFLTALRIIVLHPKKLNKSPFPISFDLQIKCIVFFTTSLVLTRLLWNYHAPRQNILTILPGLLYIVLETIEWKKKNLLKKMQLGPVLSTGLASLLCIIFFFSISLKKFTISNFFNTQVFHMTTAFDTHQVSYALIKYLLHEVQPDAEIFVVSDDYEIVFEIGLFASNLGQRKISLFTSNHNLINDLQKDYPYLSYSQDPVTAYINSTHSNKILVVRKAAYSIVTGQEVAGYIMPIYAEKYIYSGIFNTQNTQELSPILSFDTIPEWANWLIVTPALDSQ